MISCFIKKKVKHMVGKNSLMTKRPRFVFSKDFFISVWKNHKITEKYKGPLFWPDKLIKSICSPATKYSNCFLSNKVN